MHVFLDVVTKGRALLNQHAVAFAVRTVAILSMSFGTAFGFLAAIRNPAVNYDPNMFAIGTAALFGAACGALGILFSRVRFLRAELADLKARAKEIAPNSAVANERVREDHR
jgi:hypothetical protein